MSEIKNPSNPSTMFSSEKMQEHLTEPRSKMFENRTSEQSQTRQSATLDLNKSVDHAKDPASSQISEKTNSKQTNTKEQTLAVQRIFIKSSSFEAAALTETLLENMPQPIIDMSIQANYFKRSEHHFEVLLGLNLTAKLEGNLLWKIQLQQAGLYILKGFNEEQQNEILNGYCMNQLYPYACAAISALATEGGFAPVYLSPMDFTVLYREKKKQELASEKKH